MSTISTASVAIQTVVFTLLIDRRAQAVAAVAMAILAGVALGSHDASAGSALPGGPHGGR